MDSAMQHEIARALSSSDPEGRLRAVVVGWLDRGVSRDDVQQVLMEYAAALDDEGPEAEVVLTILDYLTGFCAPDRRI